MTARTAMQRDRFSPSLRDDLAAPLLVDIRAVVAGTICALGAWLLLHAIGLAAGLTRSEAGLLDAATACVAALGGGFVGGRASGPVSRVGGALHGILVWGLGALVGVWTAGGLWPGGGALWAVAALSLGLVASACGGALGVSGDQVLRARVRSGTADCLGDDAAGAAPEPGAARDLAMDEVWRELDQVRHELRRAIGHGASGVAPDRRRASVRR